MSWLVIVNLVATCFMAGLIWFVQIVHYPLLGLVPVGDAPAVAEEHQRRTSLVVAAPMAVEGLSTLWLMFDRPDAIAWGWAWAGGVCVAVWLVATVALSVPRHQRMLASPDEQLGRSLVRTNWPRTLAWTTHAVIAAVMMARLV